MFCYFFELKPGKMALVAAGGDKSDDAKPHEATFDAAVKTLKAIGK